MDEENWARNGNIWLVYKVAEPGIGRSLLLPGIGPGFQTLEAGVYIPRKSEWKETCRHRCEGLLTCSSLLLLFSHPVVSDSLQPMDCSTPGFSVPHHLPKFAQVHVHCIGDAVQPSHPLTSSSPSALSLSQISIRDFSNESAVRVRWPKYRSFSFSSSPSNEYSGLISLRID